VLDTDFRINGEIKRGSQDIWPKICTSVLIKKEKSEGEKMKRSERDQIPTVGTTVEAIMESPLFERGVGDARSGRGYPFDYDTLKDNLWAYERGRQWARVVPRHITLKVNGKITAQALQAFWDHSNDIL
jgi:hypothetical protein